jgi:hypothetical protein
MESDRPRDMMEAEILRQKNELVIAKTQAGQFGAARILSSLGTLEATPEVVEKRKNIHSDGPPVVCPEVSPAYVKESFAKKAIEKAIISFPASSSCGQSGMSPDHLKYVVLLNVRTATDVSNAMAGLTTLALNGDISPGMAKYIGQPYPARKGRRRFTPF